MTIEWPVVLLVDDDPNDQELARLAFEQAELKLRLRIVQDGEEALSVLLGAEVLTPRFVLLDLKMRRLNGFDVLERLRADERTRHLPIVVFTSSAEDRDIAVSYERGASAYVRKPIGFSEYSAAVMDIGLFWGRRNLAPVSLLGSDA